MGQNSWVSNEKNVWLYPKHPEKAAWKIMFTVWIICESRLSSSMCKSSWTGLWSKNTDPNGSILKIVSINFSMHKRRTMIIVLTTGNIVGVLGTYLADTNNDNSLILNHFILLNTEKIQRWVQEDDIFVVDRGFSDSKSILNDLRQYLNEDAWLIPKG